MDANERHSLHAEKLRRLLADEIERHESPQVADRRAGAMVDAIIAMIGAAISERLTLHEVATHGTTNSKSE